MIRQLIPVIRQLNEVLSLIGQEELSLPEVVVIGSESSGKSSVLENLIGREFLPRGNNVVTRRPVSIQLINTSDLSSSSLGKEQEWVEFAHKPGERFVNLERVREEIQKETERALTREKRVEEEPLKLKFFSSEFISLTLVDLPPICRIPNNPPLEKRCRDISASFIQNPNVLIIAITPANAPRLHSEALNLAKEVDPEGRRTMSVLTKVELAENPSEVVNFLEKGSGVAQCGVINRSYEDIRARKTLREALKSEADYFANIPAYRLHYHKLGTPALLKTFNKILFEYIRGSLPEAKTRLLKLTQDTQLLLESDTVPLFQNKSSQGAVVLQLLTTFCEDFRLTIDGKLPNISLSELSGGARLNYVFHELYGPSLNLISACEGLSFAEIRNSIRNATGPRSALFVPEQSFDLLVKKQIVKLLEPSIQCASLVHNELLRIISILSRKVFGEYESLGESVKELMTKLIKDKLVPTNDLLRDLLNIQLAHINTNHPDFLSGDAALQSLYSKYSNPDGSQANPRARDVNFTEKEQFEIELIQTLLVSYFNIVLKNVKDQVPKAIMYSLVNEVIEQMQNELVRHLYKEDLFDNLLAQSQQAAKSRHENVAKLEEYKNASATLNKIREFIL